MNSFPECADELIISEKFDSSLINKAEIPVRVITESQFKTISNSKTPQGILAVVKIPPDIYTSELPANIGSKILLLEHIQDPGNIGTLIRTAVAFGFSGIIMSRQCADPFSPKVIQATAGAVLSLWIRRIDSYMVCLDKLKADGFRVMAADIRGKSHVDFSEPKLIVALGNEGNGLTSELLDKSDIKFRIPFESQKIESLNVSVSGAVVMFCVAQGVDW